MAKKMTKAAVENAGKNAAYKSAAVANVTLADLDGFLNEWTARRDHARNLANSSAFEGLAIPIEQVPQFMEAFVDEALHLWGNKIRSREAARRTWRTACDGLRYDEAMKAIADLVESMHIRGAKIEHGRVTVLRLADSWTGPSLQWRFDRDFDVKTTNPDDDKQHAGRYALDLSVSTGGTSYSIAELAVLHKIHGELIDAAHEIEAVMSHKRVIWTFGVDEPKPAATEAAAN